MIASNLILKIHLKVHNAAKNKKGHDCTLYNVILRIARNLLERKSVCEKKYLPLQIRLY